MYSPLKVLFGFQTEQIWFVLHAGDWLFKSERISQTVGLMLDQAVEPVILNAFTYNVNLSGFLQVRTCIFILVFQNLVTSSFFAGLMSFQQLFCDEKNTQVLLTL